MNEYVVQFIAFSEALSPIELWWVIVIAFVLFLYLVYRLMGLGGVLGFILIGFFIYILYGHNSFKKYEERNRNEAIHMQQIENELLK